MYFALFIVYFFTFYSFFISLEWMASYETEGHFSYYQRGRTAYFENEGAIATIRGLQCVSAILLTWSLYWTVSSFFNIKNRCFDENNYSSPECVICGNCKKPFLAKDVPDSFCPLCKGKVVDLKGYYDNDNHLKREGSYGNMSLFTEYSRLSLSITGLISLSIILAYIISKI